MDPVTIPNWLTHLTFWCVGTMISLAFVAAMLWASLMLIEAILRRLRLHWSFVSFAICHAQGYRLIGDEWKRNGKRLVIRNGWPCIRAEDLNEEGQ